MMANFKTIETLVGELSPSYDAVVRYKEKVCVARLTYKGSYEAEIYDFCEEPDVDGFSEIECRKLLKCWRWENIHILKLLLKQVIPMLMHFQRHLNCFMVNRHICSWGIRIYLKKMFDLFFM